MSDRDLFLSRAAKGLLFFSPEIVACLLLLIQPDLLEASMIYVASNVLQACTPCLASKQFMLSMTLFAFCLSAHLLRFLGFHLRGQPLLANHSPSRQEVSISLLVAAAYLLFLFNSLNASPTSIIPGALGVMDVIGASVAALSFIVITTFVSSLLSAKEV